MRMCQRDLRDNRTLIAGKNGNSFIVGSVGRSTKISTSDSSIFMGREGVFSCNAANSATRSGSSRTSGSTRTVGSELVSFFATWLARNFRMSSKASRNSTKG